MSEELELKYDIVDPAAVAAWFDDRFPPNDEAAWREARLIDRYIDTPDHDLGRAGFGARLRTQDGEVTLTLKADLKVRGASHRRIELSGPASRSLDPPRWPTSDAREQVIRLAAGSPLVERFTLRQRRLERRLTVSGAEVLASIDEGRVLAAGRTVGRLRGLELELVSGRRKQLARLGRQVESSGLVQPEPLSKSQLGQQMAAVAAKVTRDDLFAEAGRTVLGRHLARMLDVDQRARSGAMLAIKQMRVATRRMRSVWRVFDGAYRRSEQRRHVRELRDVASRLGAVRDLDVLLAGLPPDGRLQPLADAWSAERARAMDELAAHLASDRYAEFVTDYLRFVGTPWLGTARRHAADRVGGLAAGRLMAAYGEMLLAGEDIERADDEALHALRIAAKRLRYTLETFRELVPAAPYSRLHARLVRLQDLLGDVNDAAIAAARIDGWLKAGDTPVQPAARAATTRLASRLRSQAITRRRQALRQWQFVCGDVFGRDLAIATRAIEPPAGS